MWIGVVAFVLGLSVTAYGVVDQIRSSPLERIEISKTLDKSAPYLLIPNRTLTAYPGNVQVTASGTEEVFLATVRESDATAWLTPSPHLELRLEVDQNAQKVSLAEIERPGEGNLVDPRGSDLWRSSVSGENFDSIKVPSGNEAAVMIASTGLDPAPNTVVVTWTLPKGSIPLSPIPLIGLGIMLIGALIVLLDAYLKNRGSRPGRGMRGKRRQQTIRLPKLNLKRKSGRRAQRMIATSLLAGLVLTGCATDYESPLMSPSPSAAPDTLTPVMTKVQLVRVLEEITTAIATADAELDRETIEVRVSGPALAVRRAEYNLLRRTEADDKPAPIQAGPIKLFLPSATDAWPRSVMVVTGEEQLQLLVLRQESARENYVLVHYSNLLPGTTFPEVSAETVGANIVKSDSKFLAFEPQKLPEAVGDLINNAGDSPWATLVDPENKYVMDLAAVQQNLTETLSNANLSFDHKLGDSKINMLATADGGALAALYMIDTYTIIPREPGDAVAITGDEALLLGTGGSSTGIETRYGSMLLFHIPSTGSEDPVRLLGATQQLLTTVNLGTR
ncbi:MAG: hypothetical protein EBS38_03315 [Actinobacteria bacterium]|nr:hypothetical protein [Actinomycetota bacterium]